MKQRPLFLFIGVVLLGLIVTFLFNRTFVWQSVRDSLIIHSGLLILVSISWFAFVRSGLSVITYTTAFLLALVILLGLGLKVNFIFFRYTAPITLLNALVCVWMSFKLINIRERTFRLKLGAFLLIWLTSVYWFIWPVMAYKSLQQTVQSISVEMNTKLVTSKGDTLSLEEIQQDKIILLDFWTPYCRGCYQKLDALNELMKDNEYRQKCVVLVVEPEYHLGHRNYYKDILELQKDRPYPFVYAFDMKGKLAKAIGVEGIPDELLITQENQAVHRMLGYSNEMKHVYLFRIKKMIDQFGIQ
jgi:thiol-disulfide isomerase/thioredoxin